MTDVRTEAGTVTKRRGCRAARAGVLGLALAGLVLTTGCGSTGRGAATGAAAGAAGGATAAAIRGDNVLENAAVGAASGAAAGAAAGFVASLF